MYSACDISKKAPQAAVGTHGYMAPEVLTRGQSYGYLADWFSLGCMLYKLLKGHRLQNFRLFLKIKNYYFLVLSVLIKQRISVKSIVER